MDKLNSYLDKLIQDDGLTVTVNVKFPPDTIMQIGLTALVVMACGKIISVGIGKLLG